VWEGGEGTLAADMQYDKYLGLMLMSYRLYQWQLPFTTGDVHLYDELQTFLTQSPHVKQAVR
jgi:hypothetical protein